MRRSTDLKLGAALLQRSADAGRRKKAKGDRAELLVLTALGRESRPTWILDVRKASRKEDHDGLDVIVETVDRGRVALQVKSSKAGAKRFRARSDVPVEVVIVYPTDDLNTIYGKAMGKLLLLRERSTLR